MVWRGHEAGDGIPWQEVTVFAEVVFPLPVDRSFQYGIPEILLPVIKPGCRVIAPFGRQDADRLRRGRRRWAAGRRIRDSRTSRDVLDQTPSFSAGFLRFTKELSARSFAPWGEVLAAALPPTLVPKDRRKVSLTPAGREALEKGTLGKRERKLASLPRARQGAQPGISGEKNGSQEPFLSPFCAWKPKGS